MPRQTQDLSDFLDGVDGLGEPDAPVPPVPAIRPSPVAVRMADEPVAVRTLEASPRQAVLEAGWRARDHPEQWEEFGWRSPAELAQRLKERLAFDRTTRREFRGAHQNHYLTVALAMVPDDPVKAAELGMEWRRAHRGPTRMANGSGRLVDSAMYERMRRIADALPAINSTAKVWEITAWALSDLLDRLDEADAAATGG